MIDGINYDHVLQIVSANLQKWDFWAFWSKILAVFLGAIVSALGVLIASKILPDFWHYSASALVAAAIFIYGLLNPYEEYKQFRAAITHVEPAYTKFVGEKNRENYEAVIKAQDEGRQMLKETWDSPKLDMPPTP